MKLSEREYGIYAQHQMKNKTGEMSLMAIVITMTIAAVILVSLSSMLNNLMRGQKHVELKGELEALRQTLVEAIDCEGTFQSAGIDPYNPLNGCDSTSSAGSQVGPYLRLRRKTLDG